MVARTKTSDSAGLTTQDIRDPEYDYQVPPWLTASSTTNSGLERDGEKPKESAQVVVHNNTDHDAALAAALAAEDGGQRIPNGARDFQEDAMMRLLIAQLRLDWGDSSPGGESYGSGLSGKPIPPSLERRIRDFQFARDKRRDKYGDIQPRGVLALFDHLTNLRIDLEWAEDAAWRREHGEPYLSWTDFEQSRAKGFNKPFFMYFVFAVSTIMMLVSFYYNDWKIETPKVNPMIGPSAVTLVKIGAKQTNLIVPPENEWYRLIAPMGLHAGIIHYVINMLAVVYIGGAVEQSHGHTLAALVFVVPAVGGTIVSALFLPEYISVGASGGIFGFIGACLADIGVNWNFLFSKHVNFSDDGSRIRHTKVLMWLIFDMVINTIIGLTPFVDNFTHMAGLVYGFLVGLTSIHRITLDFFGVPTDCWSRVRRQLVRGIGITATVVLLVTSTSLLYENEGQKYCSNCRYVSCVPLPPWKGDDDKWWYCDDCLTAEAQVHKDDVTGYYDRMNMTCPDGEVVFGIDLEEDHISDVAWLGRQLPTFCRDHCENLFA